MFLSWSMKIQQHLLYILISWWEICCGTCNSRWRYKQNLILVDKMENAGLILKMNRKTALMTMNGIMRPMKGAKLKQYIHHSLSIPAHDDLWAFNISFWDILLTIEFMVELIGVVRTPWKWDWREKHRCQGFDQRKCWWWDLTLE